MSCKQLTCRACGEAIQAVFAFDLMADMNMRGLEDLCKSGALSVCWSPCTCDMRLVCMFLPADQELKKWENRLSLK